MPVKDYYFNLLELDEEYGGPCISEPFKFAASTTIKVWMDDLGMSYPDVQTNLNSANVTKLWKSVVSRFFYNAALRITIPCEASIEDVDIRSEYIKWIWRFLALLDQTSPYYLTLLEAYDSAATSLMDDITATSKNKVKFNDTPQNANTGDVYEGDNYITNFTSTEGESSSPLMSKIMRLKEIQDHYKSVMGDWVNEFQKLFYEVEIH